MQNLNELASGAKTAIAAAQNLAQLEDLRVEYFGKKGIITELLKNLKDLSLEQKKEYGGAINNIKIQIHECLEQKKAQLIEQKIAAELAKNTLDVTLAGRNNSYGGQHPVSTACARISEIFTRCGFTIAFGPEIESSYYNFTALNFPLHHPARAMQDTFYIDNEYLLRTHMSPEQIRYMQNNQPPLRIISPGRVYRHDFDVTHTPMFHQMEGLVVDKDISFANLKELLIYFLNTFFDKQLQVRLRPSFFPFTEPSAEVDINCFLCNGANNSCPICKGSGWLEVLGCGMVHPNVLRECNIDSNEYSGFAFGLGIDRLAMLYYGITDLRLLFENDLRFLQQF